MNKAELQEMKEDRLANASVVAFLGALLIGQSWVGILEGSASTVDLFFLFTIPNYTWIIILAVIFGLFGLSLFLALASMVPSLQHRGLRRVKHESSLFMYIIFASFGLSWLSSISVLPSDQWWTRALIWGGMGMLVFIGFRRKLMSLSRFLPRRVRLITGHESVANTEPDGTRVGRTDSELEPVRNLRRNLRIPQSGEFWIFLLAVVLALEVWLVVVNWDWLAGAESASATIRNAGLVIAGSLAIPLAIWRAVVADKRASSAQHQTAIAQQGLLNERYQKAAEMLGSDVLSVRIGGVHALRDLGVEHPNQYHVRVMRLLCAFARNPAKSGPDGEELATRRMHSDVPFLMLREDLQAVMDVFRGRSDAEVHLEEKERFRIRLQHAVLRGAILHGADLRRAILWGADLSEAYLALARLDCACLDEAKLSDAQLSDHGDSPVTGLTQQQLDKASRDIETAPKLDEVLDARTKKQLVWNKMPTSDQV